MNATLDGMLRSWPVDPWLCSALVVSGVIYLRGWLVLRRRDPRRWHVGRLTAFFGALAATFLALASPIEAFASFLLQVHMVQHLLLMMVAPPLVWVSWPMLPLVRGLPREVRRVWVAPVVRWHPLKAFCQTLTSPQVALPVYIAVTWLWHAPRTYALALESSAWHVAEHISFFAAALVFWYPVLLPYPSRLRFSRWLMIPYLLLADVANTILSAWLTFSSRVLYAHYDEVPRLFGLSALDDQSVAGVLMWVPGSICYLVPVFVIGIELLFGRAPSLPLCAPVTRPRGPAIALAASLPVIDLRGLKRPAPSTAALDLLGIPAISRFLRWRYARMTLQFVLAAVALVVIYDGLKGPQAAPMNLAGVLPWIHWRGAVVFGLLALGNVFCLACPFTLPRAVARRWMPEGATWPRWLRNKWLAVALLAIFLWSYEAFALWDRPGVTAWIAVGYFVTAFVVDSLFRGAAFCKYVCPIGQFNFVQSLISPFEVKVRSADVCASCHTKECIRGTPAISGCQMHLFQPRKMGNLDCTFCLDCVRACPHENVGVLAVVPGHSLWIDPLRSGIGRLSRRPDVAALVVVLVFGALANAAGMIAPVVQWQDQLGNGLGGVSRLAMTSGYYLVALVALPLVAVELAAVLSRAGGRLRPGVTAVATSFAYALVPLGFGMWLAHYSFHFLTSFDTVVPTTQRFLGELGFSGIGEPAWQMACCRSVGDWLLHLEIVMLDLGLLLSLYAAYRIAETQAQGAWRALAAFAPWGVLILLLFAAGVWIVFQPMQMRGTLAMGG